MYQLLWRVVEEREEEVEGEVEEGERRMLDEERRVDKSQSRRIRKLLNVTDKPNYSCLMMVGLSYLNHLPFRTAADVSVSTYSQVTLIIS